MSDFSVEALEWIIDRAIAARDIRAIEAALMLLAVQAPDRAQHWRQMMLVAIRAAESREERP